MIASSKLANVKWQKFDAVTSEMLQRSDLTVESYMLNELRRDDVSMVLMKMWQATNKVMLLVEPGTPRGFANICEARKLILEVGGHVVAPCTHELKCPLAADDWCAFSCRVQRTAWQKMLKRWHCAV